MKQLLKEDKIQVTKSDVKNMIMECVMKYITEKMYLL